MKHADLILLHPPITYRFRELPILHGPSNVAVPSSPIFENYPIGFLTLSEYLHRQGISVRIVNLAVKMLLNADFDPDAFIARLKPVAFGIDLHWLPHVDGSLTTAALAKHHHPEIPVILGGLSATYFHQEIMADYPDIDFVVRGDSTEEPLRLLMAAIMGDGDFARVPNLVWRDAQGDTVVNPASYHPDSLDHVSFDCSHPLQMAVKYRDPTGYLPFGDWLASPLLAVFSCRGCIHNCAPCGGSGASFDRLCGRAKPAFRSPERLAADIGSAARYSGAPIMVIADPFQAGQEYVDRFLTAMKQQPVRNQIGFEFFRPPPPAQVRQLTDNLVSFNVELSPESHDPKVRKAFGKGYDNTELETSIEAFMASSCQRLDLFFMIGLPYQDYQSVMATVAYCGELLQRYGRDQRLMPIIAPLTPFVDPGSRLFEEPERFGYRLFYRTLAEHRQAMLMPTWKLRLNYETDWMTRDDIVRATYDATARLAELKAEYRLMTAAEAAAVGRQMRLAGEVMARLEAGAAVDAPLKEELAGLNRFDARYGKHELRWPVEGWRINLATMVKMFFGRP